MVSIHQCYLAGLAVLIAPRPPSQLIEILKSFEGKVLVANSNREVIDALTSSIMQVDMLLNVDAGSYANLISNVNPIHAHAMDIFLNGLSPLRLDAFRRLCAELSNDEIFHAIATFDCQPNIFDRTWYRVAYNHFHDRRKELYNTVKSAEVPKFGTLYRVMLIMPTIFDRANNYTTPPVLVSDTIVSWYYQTMSDHDLSEDNFQLILPESDVTYVYIDRHRLWTALTNCATNAIAASKKAGGPLVTVQYSLESPWHLFTIKNNGAEFSSAQLSQLNDVFRTPTLDTAGTKIIRSATLGSGGRFSFSNTDDVGALVTLRFPLVLAK